MQPADYQRIVKSLFFDDFSLARPIGGPEWQQQGDIQYFSSIFFIVSTVIAPLFREVCRSLRLSLTATRHRA
jgi:hypothetical protein